MKVKVAEDKQQFTVGDVIKIRGGLFLVVEGHSSMRYMQGDKEYHEKRFYLLAFDGKTAYCEPRTMSELHQHVYSHEIDVKVYPKGKYYLELKG
ncbi:hypothetical protein F373_gp233 [Bacillus phage SP-10]|uniref:hypothetical protein n=1 Tax=Bacillus phage SP10 TaxID=941058 RepID=UPI0002198BBD|nr:hypothetical protein F373_gp233 [Bacillus phage SP-10]BAK53045.1 hypothetical protein [Bacillus phage SP-10]